MVQPVTDQVLRKTECITPFEYISVDEKMVPYTGALDIKKYIRGKPVPWGIKIFILLKSNDVKLTFNVYQEKKSIFTDKQKEFAIGPGMVLALASRAHFLTQNFSVTTSLQSYRCYKN
jgi:hypothetical protein